LALGFSYEQMEPQLAFQRDVSGFYIHFFYSEAVQVINLMAKTMDFRAKRGLRMAKHIRLQERSKKLRAEKVTKLIDDVWLRHRHDKDTFAA
jgi:hypothetical protein